jgi:nickel-dependent lactate racemase
MIKINQQLDAIKITDLDSHVTAELGKTKMATRLKPGEKVAITVGSRGITDIVTIVASVVNWIKAHGGDPFLVPAMGSHGGATAEGQAQILEDYGLLESKVGAPIVSSMEVNHLGETRSGIPVMLDRNACNADHIIVLNRVKPHTEFHGKIESGLTKMIAIGLGKLKGTIMAHRYAVKYGYERTLSEIGLHALENAPVSLGLAIIENTDMVRQPK